MNNHTLYPIPSPTLPRLTHPLLVNTHTLHLLTHLLLVVLSISISIYKHTLSPIKTPSSSINTFSHPLYTTHPLSIDTGERGELVFGGTDPAHYTGTIVWVPLVSKTYWAITLGGTCSGLLFASMSTLLLTLQSLLSHPPYPLTDTPSNTHTSTPTNTHIYPLTHIYILITSLIVGIYMYNLGEIPFIDQKAIVDSLIH